MTGDEAVPPGAEPTRPSPARLYDYYLGGTCNFEVDRQAAEQIRAVRLVARYMEAVVPGSYPGLSHVTFDKLPPQISRAGREVYARTGSDIHARTAAEFTRFSAGLDLVEPQPGAEPGITYSGLWGAEDLRAADSDGSRATYCAVARKPGTEAG